MAPQLVELIKADKNFAVMSKEKGAALAFEYFLSKDSIILPNNNLPILGRPNIVNFMKAPGSNYDLLWTPESGRVSESGDMGFTWGFYEMIIRNNNGEKIESEKGKYLNVWVNEDGSWKVLVDIGNMNPRSQ